MELQDFKEALDSLGLKYRESGKSLVLQHCPECGSDKFKVHLRLDREEENAPFLGRCYAGACQTNYSSFKYLLRSGMPYSEVLSLHKGNHIDSIEKMIPKTPPSKEQTEEKKEEYKPQQADISKFFKLKNWLEHPAAKYAISRGAVPEWDFVMIDHETTSVVFVVFESGVPVGYQRRYVVPFYGIKTRTSDGFSKNQHILEFPNPGKDILVCEGPFTAVSAWHFGYHAVCTFGSAVSIHQINKIVKLSDELKVNVGVAFDEDAAGLKGYNTIRSALYWLDKPAFRVKPSTGNDLNDAWLAGGKAIVVEEKAQYNPAIPELRRFY